MRKTFFSFLLILLILIIPVSAYTSYTKQYQSGANSAGKSIFDSSAIVADYKGVPLTNPQGIPFIADVQNDGKNEIIILNNGGIYIYKWENNVLSLIDGTAIENYSINHYSDIGLADLDDNGYFDFSYFSAVANLTWIYEYNGTTFIKNNISMPALVKYGTPTYTDNLITCDDTKNICVLQYGNKASSVNRTLIAFNKTNTGTSIVTTESANDFYLCLSNHTANLQMEDTDGDSNLEIITTYAVLGAAAQIERFRLSGYQVTPALVMSHEGTYTYPVGNIDSSSSCLGNSGFRGLGNFISGAVIGEFDGAPSTQKEYAFAFNPSANTNVKMFILKHDFTFFDDFPEASSGSGYLISNPVAMKAFPDSTSNSDVCVLLYNSESSSGVCKYDGTHINLMCGSKTTNYALLAPETKEFRIGVDYNLSFYDGLKIPSIHAIENDVSINMDEIITPYGIFKLTFSYVLCGESLTAIQEFPISSGAWIPVDYEKNSRSDMIGATATNLWYFSDTWANTGCSMENCIAYSIDPCINQAWKINTTNVISVTVTDIDGDSVRARAQFYADSVYLQDSNWTAFYASGTTFSFADFKPNTTITNGIIRIMANDVANNASIETMEFPFSVAADGVEYGDCKTSYTPASVAISANVTVSGANSQTNNSITQAVSTFAQLSGLPSALIVLLILVFCLGYGIYAVVINQSEIVKIMSIILSYVIFMLLLFIFAYVKLISYGYFITFMIISIIGGAIAVIYILNRGMGVK